MNDRIRELAKQASDYARGESDYGYFTDSDEFNIQFEHKFAQLIVQECVDIADEYDAAGSTIVSRIKKHFGVE